MPKKVSEHPGLRTGAPFKRPSMIWTARTTLLALLLLTVFPVLARPDEDAAESKPEATPAPEPHRWAVGEANRYLWFRGRERAGTTTFTVVPHPTRDGFHVVQVSLSYDHQATQLRIQRTYEVDEQWRLRRTESVTTMAGARNSRSVVRETGFVDGKWLVMEVVNNESEAETNRFRVPLPAGTFAMFPQGLEFWALYLPHMLPLTPGVKKIVYPHFDRTFEVEFERVGPVEHRHGEREVRLEHFKFQSKNRQIHGEVWIDAHGKLYQYKQTHPKDGSTLVVVLETPKATEEGKPAGQKKKKADGEPGSS